MNASGLMMNFNTTEALEMAYGTLDSVERTAWNPLGLEMHVWIAFVVLKAIGVTVLDPIVLGFCKLFRVSKLPSREPEPIAKGLEELVFKDYLFLFINQIMEGIGMMYFGAFALFEDESLVSRDLTKVTLGNTLGFTYIVFLLDDFMYYFAHRFMHHPSVYALCHKHHHRQSMPTRGYFDAANEHPLEQFIGLALVIVSFQMAARLPTGAHAVGVAIFIMIYAVMAFLNHTEYDVQFGPLGLGYSVRAHEMHHRFPQCNYAQNTMIWDQILGTFKVYRDGHRTKDA
mmetsp:Transcript_1031/g.2501  ORF Transcript_1031/g.2501 Transcript_1031/m.2501 type:complete len:286 (-) Transcript_1031:678-1535(-)|eukprot:CAMPEP_0171489830 /NCGR_PEP_ID=MMETSP0958-20121227/2978_1 /TAXON_ID=87120 /ORGANISM="Aurantiochytrium limacinum, Strain ATCCMYA-1381" /LENGTH=285 /DNA_ID=CAMNT_0012023093 /DNA_START=273 /DNA_END=1130 /DNA_ORIENTATION=-